MRNMAWRLILALGAGIIVTGLCFDLTVVGMGAGYVTRPQDRTRYKLKELNELAQKYRRQKGHWPASIADMDYDWVDTPRQDREIRDGWRRPIIYERRGSSYRAVSYGADGKPGGVSLNCDLSSDDLNPPEAKVPPLEILLDPSLGLMKEVALICGALVAAITFASIGNREFKREKWLGLAVHLIVLIAASALVALFITALDVPSGH